MAACRTCKHARVRGLVVLLPRALLHREVCNVCVVGQAGVCRPSPLVGSITQAHTHTPRKRDRRTLLLLISSPMMAALFPQNSAAAQQSNSPRAARWQTTTPHTCLSRHACLDTDVPCVVSCFHCLTLSTHLCQTHPTCRILNNTTSSLAGLVASNLHCVVSSTMAFTASGAPCAFRPASTHTQAGGSRASSRASSGCVSAHLTPSSRRRHSHNWIPRERRLRQLESTGLPGTAPCMGAVSTQQGAGHACVPSAPSKVQDMHACQQQGRTHTHTHTHAHAHAPAHHSAQPQDAAAEQAPQRGQCNACWDGPADFWLPHKLQEGRQELQRLHNRPVCGRQHPGSRVVA